MRRATCYSLRHSASHWHFYPRSPCGERRPLIFNVQPRKTISIHALLAESDKPGKIGPNLINNFYPRSPCGERPPKVFRHCTTYLFLSTLSLRRATNADTKTPHFTSYFYPRSGPAWLASRFNFYPRSPCGERRVTVLGIQHKVGISIHALLAESDAVTRVASTPTTVISIHALLAESDLNSFYSLKRRLHISIHALLAESDAAGRVPRPRARYFYPRSPCGERRSHYQRSFHCVGFLSTLSLRRATGMNIVRSSKGVFLSTLSLRRATAAGRVPRPRARYFYPRSPCGERQAANSLADTPPQISIHALLAESDYQKNLNL